MEWEARAVCREKGLRRMLWPFSFNPSPRPPTNDLKPYPAPSACVAATTMASGLPNNTRDNETSTMPACGRLIRQHDMRKEYDAGVLTHEVNDNESTTTVGSERDGGDNGG